MLLSSGANTVDRVFLLFIRRSYLAFCTKAANFVRSGLLFRTLARDSFDDLITSLIMWTMPFLAMQASP